MVSKEEIEETTVHLNEQAQQQREQLFSQKESLEKKENKIEVLEDVVAERKEEALFAAEMNNAQIAAQKEEQKAEAHSLDPLAKWVEEEEIIKKSGSGYIRPVDEVKAKEDIAVDMQQANEVSRGLYLTDGTKTEITFTDTSVTMKAGSYEVSISNDEKGNTVYSRSAMDHRGIVEESRMLAALEYNVTGLKNAVSVDYAIPQDKDGKELSVQGIFSSNLSPSEMNKAFSQCTMAVAAAHMGRTVTMGGEPFAATKPGFERMSEEVAIMAQYADVRQELLQRGPSGLKPVPTALPPIAKQEVTPTPLQPTITKDVGQDIADAGTKSKKDAVMTQMLDKGRSGLKPTPANTKADAPVHVDRHDKANDSSQANQHGKAEVAAVKSGATDKPASHVVTEAREKAGGVNKLQHDAASQATVKASEKAHTSTAPKAGGSSG